MLRKRLKFTPVDPETGPHPILRLPSELLGVIFSFATSEDECESLGLVCKVWCHATLGFGRKNPTGIMGGAARRLMVDVMEYIITLQCDWDIGRVFWKSVHNRSTITLQWLIHHNYITHEILMRVQTMTGFGFFDDERKYSLWETVVVGAATSGNISALRHLQQYYATILEDADPAKRPELVIPMAPGGKIPVEDVLRVFEFVQTIHVGDYHREHWILFALNNIAGNYNQLDALTITRFLIEQIAEGEQWVVDEALYSAAFSGQLEVAKYLIENGADVHHDHDSALIDASSGSDNLQMVKFLLANGADVHAMNDEPLHLAAMYGLLDIVQLLLENGANVHAYNEEALRRAAAKGHLDVVKYMVEKGANIGALSGETLSPNVRKWLQSNDFFFI